MHEDEEPRARPKVAISGAFSPLLLGHIRLIKDASKYGDVIVILNSDSWLRRNMIYEMLPWNERAEILRSIKGVKDVIIAKDDDDTVVPTLKLLYPHYFANGGKRKMGNTPEVPVCIELDIALLWGVGD